MSKRQTSAGVMLTAAALSFPAMAQPCQSYYADMGPTPHSFSESYFAVLTDGTGSRLFRGDYLDRTFIEWTASGWQLPSLAGTGAGFEPVSPWVLTEESGPQLYVMGYIGSSLHMYKRVGSLWVDSGICMGPCPPFQTVGQHMTSVDLGSGFRIYATGYRPLQNGAVVVRHDAAAGWTTIGVSNSAISAIVQFDDGTGPALYALGDFTTMSGVVTRGLAKWDGQVWTAATPPDTQVYGGNATLVADLGDGPAIYTTAKVFRDGQDFVGVNKWDGQQWSFIGAPDQLPPPATARYINCMEVFDDGRGMALYIGGLFQSFSGVTARNIVRWDGATFEALGAGTFGEVEDVHGFIDQRGPAVHLSGGIMTNAGGGVLQQQGVLWVGCPNCYANCDLSTRTPVLNVADFICYLNKFAAKDPYANCSGDATININDFTCFLSKFAAGCP